MGNLGQDATQASAVRHSVRGRLCVVALPLLALAIATCAGDPETPAAEETQPPAEAPAPRELTVLVGAGKSTSSVNAYFPSTVRIRTGDTVTWNMNSDGDPHTVTFNKPQDQFDIISVPGGGPKGAHGEPEAGLANQGTVRPYRDLRP